MTAEECRSHAKECRDLARIAHAEATRLGLDDIALTWDMLARAQDKKAESNLLAPPAEDSARNR